MLYMPRRHRRKLLLPPGLLALILVWLPIARSWACSCVETETSIAKRITKAYEKADLVFVGKVIKSETLVTTDTVHGTDGKTRYVQRDNLIRYTFSVSRLLKGKTTNSFATVISDAEESTCGRVFKAGTTYLVYANLNDRHFPRASKVKSFYHTSLCTRTRYINFVEVSELVALEDLRAKN